MRAVRCKNQVLFVICEYVFFPYFRTLCNKIELDFDIVGLYVSADENNTLEALSSNHVFGS